MQVTVERKPQSIAAITVELQAEEFGRYYDEALAELAKGLTEDGFRPGHVPAAIAASRVGEPRILEEASRLALAHTYPDIIEEQGIEPTGAPKAEVLKIARQNPFVYRVEVPVVPDIALPDWRTLAAGVARQTVSVVDVEVAEALAYLQRSRATLTSVDRPAREGDRLEVDFTVTSEGAFIPGGESKNHPVIIGEHRFVPGFEEELVGLKRGEQKTFSISVPADFSQKAIAGKDVEFAVTVSRLDERAVPELTDEFARQLGAFADLAALRESAREGIQAERDEAVRNRRREQALAAIAAQSEVEVPDRLVDGELERMVHDFGHTLEHSGTTLADYLMHLGKTEAAFREGLRPTAAERAKHALIIRAIAKAEEIAVSDAEVAERSRRILAQFHSAKEAGSTIDPGDLAAYTRGVLRTEKVLELLDAA